MVESLKTYATVKSYSFKGQILDKKTYQFFAESRTLEELITRMRNSRYGEAVSKISKPLNSEKVELALRGRQAELHYLLINSVGGSGLLLDYFLKFIFKNLKIILKAKALGKVYEEIEPHINLRAEQLIGRRDVVIKALTAKNIEEAAGILKIENYENETSKALSLYNESKIPSVFDIYLDKALFRHLAHVIKGSANVNILSLFGMDLDFYNIMSILRGKFWGLEQEKIQDFVVPHTSSTSQEMLLRMISSDTIKSAVNELTITKYNKIIPENENEIDLIKNFEHSFEIFIHKAILEEFTKMFSLSVVIAMSRLLDYEVRNLSSIAYSVEQKISPEITISKLIISE